MNKLFIISGPSGSGKTTTLRKAMANEVVSFTTRKMRNGEVNGVDYNFITEEEFQTLLTGGDIAEHTTYYGSASYGITREEIAKKLEFSDAFVVVDVVGKAQLEEIYSKTTSVFFRVEKETAIARMKLRGDSQEIIDKRMLTFDEESNNYYLYDYIIENEGTKEDTRQAIKYVLDIEGTKVDVSPKVY